MKRLVATTLLLLVAAACRESALASGTKGADPNVALCAAAHTIPTILLEYHHAKINEQVTLERLAKVRELIGDNATGRYASHLRDVAAAVHVFEIVTESRGDTSDAYRDLRTLRESLPRCPAAVVKSAVAPRVMPKPGVTSG